MSVEKLRRFRFTCDNSDCSKEVIVETECKKVDDVIPPEGWNLEYSGGYVKRAIHFCPECDKARKSWLDWQKNLQ